jgi:hypothetical protein
MLGFSFFSWERERERKGKDKKKGMNRALEKTELSNSLFESSYRKQVHSHSHRLLV